MGRLSYITKLSVIIAFSLLLSPKSFGGDNTILIRRQIVFAQNGLCNLSDKNFDKHVFALFGKWQFYWHQLLTPKNIDSSKNFILVNVPKFWSKYKINGHNLPEYGYATYRLKVVLPKNIHKVTIAFHGVFTAYKLWVNGKYIDQNGIVGTSRKTSYPSWQPKNYTVYTHNDTLDIIVQVSNFQHYRCGITRQVIIGTPETYLRYSSLSIGYEAAIIGALLIMALNFLLFFYYQKTNISSLYLALILLAQAINTSLDGEYIMFRLFPNFNWFFAVHLLYFLLFYKTILFIYYIYYLVPKEFNIKIIIGVSILAFIMEIYSIVMPIHTFGFALDVYFLFAYLSGIYLGYILIKAVKYQIGALYALLGTIAILVTGINDSLYDLGYIHTFYALGLGVFIFTFTISIIIAMYTARTERKILGYSLMLRKLEALRDELSIIPIYELDRILKTVTQMLKIDRALWLDVQNDKIIVRYEYDLTQVHEINKDLHNLSPNYISSKLLSACKKHKKVLAFNLDRKSRRKLFNKKKIKKSGPITEYMIYKNISALLCAPITKDNKILSFIYFENKFSPISFFHKTLVKSISSQLTTIKITSDNFKSLQELNKKLEDLVEKRTRLLQQQTAELNEKEKELKEKIEELELYNEQLNAIHNDLERHKQEIEQKNFELEKIHTSILEQKQISEERNKKLTENLLFAKTIQQIILQIDSNLPFADLFIFYKPKQIVSGDFYWIKNFKNKTVIAVADCTGHGVPGAFMSLLSASILKDTITKNFITLNNPEIPPGKLLDQIRDKIIKILGQEFYTSVFDSFNIKDGMDIALAIYDKTSNNISYAGAYIPMWIIRDEQLFEFKADRQPIGIYYKPQQIKPFRTQKFQLKKGDIIYMFSDGFADQFNPNGEKFYKKNLKKLLLEIHHYPGSIQRDLLEKTFLQWKGDYFQVDDVLVVGIII